MHIYYLVKLSEVALQAHTSTVLPVKTAVILHKWAKELKPAMLFLATWGSRKQLWTQHWQFLIYTCSSWGATLSFIWSCVSGQLMTVSSNIPSLLALFLVSTNSWGKCITFEIELQIQVHHYEWSLSHYTDALSKSTKISSVKCT